MDINFNNALLTILTTKYKKYMEKEIKLVEEAGYIVSKWNGAWHIKNVATMKTIWGSGEYNHCTIYSNSARYNFVRDDKAEDHGCKADLRGMLDTPVNKYFLEYQRSLNWENDYTLGGTNIRAKRAELKSAKREITDYDKSIEKTKKEIEALTKKIEAEVVARERAKQRLNTVRENLGLKTA